MDEQKKSLQRQLREVEKLPNMVPALRDKQKEAWKEELEEIERERTELLPEQQKMQRRSQKLRSLREKQRNHLKTARDSEKKCKRSLRMGRKRKQITRRASEFCRKGLATLGKRQQHWIMKSQTCRQAKKEEAAVLRNQKDAPSTLPCWSTSSPLEEPRQCSSSHFFRQKSAEYMAVNNIGKSQLLRSEEEEQKKRKR